MVDNTDKGQDTQAKEKQSHGEGAAITHRDFMTSTAAASVAVRGASTLAAASLIVPESAQAHKFVADAARRRQQRSFRIRKRAALSERRRADR